MAQGFATFAFRDYKGDPSSFRVRMAEVTAANFDAQATLVSNLETAIAAFQVADVPVARLQHGNETIDNQDKSSTPAASRKCKAMIRYEDDTTKEVYRTTIACADLSHLDADNRGYFDMDDGGDVAALVTAFEAAVISPEAGNSVTVLSIQHVGRDL
jgi:hypothetical protein